MHHLMLYLPVMGFLGVPAAGMLSGVSHIFKKGSPRFEGGPLVSTVNGFLQKIASGDLQVLRDLWRTATNQSEKHRKQWRDVWDQLMPQQPLTEAQRKLILQLDPSKSGVALGSTAFTEASGEVSPLSQAAEPLRSAVTGAVEQVREGAAGTVEAVGVGGGAALSRKLRGGTGPLDTLIAVVKKPGGAAVAVVVGVLLIIGITSALTRRRS